LWKWDWLAPEDFHGCALEGSYLQKDEKISKGTMVDLPSHHVRILGCIISPLRYMVLATLIRLLVWQIVC
jgi:hypothetical protein